MTEDVRNKKSMKSINMKFFYVTISQYNDT